MKTSRRKALALGLVTAGTALLAGCIVVPAGGRGGQHAGYGGQAGYGGNNGDPVMVAPPPPQSEVYGVAPAIGYFWIGGFWNWVGGRHVWTGGHWEAPRQGYRWQPHRWSNDGQGWRANPGRWERR